MARTRYTATVVGYTKFNLKNAILLSDVKDFTTGKPVDGVTRAYFYFDNKEALRNERRLFLGNKIAFDASVEMDSSVGMHRMAAPKNFCGKAVKCVPMVDDNTRMLDTTKSIEWADCGTYGYCGWCKHYDCKKCEVKGTCAANKLT